MLIDPAPRSLCLCLHLCVMSEQHPIRLGHGGLIHQAGGWFWFGPFSFASWCCVLVTSPILSPEITVLLQYLLISFLFLFINFFYFMFYLFLGKQIVSFKCVC